MVYFNFCSFGSTGWQSTAHQQPKPQSAEHQPADPRDDGSQRPHRLHHRQGRHQDRWDQVVFLNLLNYLCVIVSWPSLVQTIVNRPTLVRNLVRYLYPIMFYLFVNYDFRVDCSVRYFMNDRAADLPKRSANILFEIGSFIYHNYFCVFPYDSVTTENLSTFKLSLLPFFYYFTLH